MNRYEKQGERACAPEDVGGLYGFFEFCNALKNPKPEEKGSYMEWSGGASESERFDINAVNRELMKYLRWSRDRIQHWGGIE